MYQHDVVIHAQNFVDPNHLEVNTQAAEGLWMQAKHKLRYQSGTSRALFPSYLDAFQWRFNHKIHPFGQHLKSVPVFTASAHRRDALPICRPQGTSAVSNRGLT